MSTEGILLVDKPENMSSFAVVAQARRRLGVKKIGHGGTLDPFATGLLVLLVGRNFTKRADEFLQGDKEYQACLKLGVATDSYDSEGQETFHSDKVPTLEEIEAVLKQFQGTIDQIPPMFSAKKINGKRLYELARKGEVVERKAVRVTVEITFIRYSYPELELHVRASKGTYIRSLADDIGKALGCYAHLISLRRLRSGRFSIEKSIDLVTLKNPEIPLTLHS
ncbi:MAG: tRNA pseudouridine(55) synthase TruB [Verrucomicrobia bacterium]|nr:tRNA pseudouridine(55) synthase TruB [Verrucomicrobiota bacterium]MBS0636150.1 tRNA pseudouridine(55) synthase TruB [Verrucomicrobiota bacterium]